MQELLKEDPASCQTATGLANSIMNTEDPDFESDYVAANAELMGYAYTMAEERRRCPADDIVTKLVQADVDGEWMDDVEFAFFVILLAVAGNETTRNLIAHAMLALIDNPQARKELVAGIDDEALWDSAVEEMLRWGASIHNFRRTATCDTEVRGVPIKAGQKVVTKARVTSERIGDCPA